MEPQLSKKGTAISTNSFRAVAERDLEMEELAGGFKGGYFFRVALVVFDVLPSSPIA
jgi:hypothetical protein